MTRIKLALVIMAILVFGYGVRNDVSFMRWIAIGILALAFVLRFAAKLTPK